MPQIRLTKELSGRILDIGGGGEGVIGRVYGMEVTAIDNSACELAEAPDNCEKLLMDACRMTFADSSFDHATAFFSLMYMSRPEQARALCETCRVLKPGGTLTLWDAVIAENAPNPFLIDLDIDADGQWLHTTYGVGKEDAAQNAESLAQLCEAAELRVENVQQADECFVIHCRKEAEACEKCKACEETE